MVAMFRKLVSRLMGAIPLSIVIIVGLPALMLIGFYVFVGIGESTGWYNPYNDITISDH